MINNIMIVAGRVIYEMSIGEFLDKRKKELFSTRNMSH